jgi:hypothetical protein
MDIEDCKKTALKTKPVFPTALPLAIEREEAKREFLAGFEDGWESYKRRIKQELKLVKSYGVVISLANIDVPHKVNHSIYNGIGFTNGWKSYGRFLKSTFFG